MLTGRLLASWTASLVTSKTVRHAPHSLLVCALPHFEDLLEPTQVEAFGWLGIDAPVDDTYRVAIAVTPTSVPRELTRFLSERREQGAPRSLRARGRTRVLEPSGVDYVLDDLLTIEVTRGGPLLDVTVNVHCDAFLPFDVFGAAQEERWALNAPRLQRALAALAAELGAELEGDGSDYVVVDGVRMLNRRERDGELVSTYEHAEYDPAGPYCTLHLFGASVRMGQRIRSGAGDEVRIGSLMRDSQQRVLITFAQGHDETWDVSMSNLALDVPGIAPLRWIGPLHEDGINYADALIEDLPEGRPALELAPLSPAAIAAIGAASAHAVASAHERDLLVRGIRPELIYVDEALNFTGLVPRGPGFIASSAQRVSGLRSYPLPYDGFEALALGKPAGKPGDIFALCATLQHLATGRQPFGDEFPEILQRVVANARDPYPGSKELDDILARGMDPDPARRPTAEELAKLLAALTL